MRHIRVPGESRVMHSVDMEASGLDTALDLRHLLKLRLSRSRYCSWSKTPVRI